MSIDPQYHNLIASLPDQPQIEKQQWLHHSCGGNLQIGSDGAIRCEKCNTQQPALSWFVTQAYQLSEAPPEAKQMNFQAVASLAGQVAREAGKPWLSKFLIHIQAEDEINS